MLFLNLLPSQFSQEIKTRKLWHIVARSGLVVLFVVILLSVVFYTSNKILNNFYGLVTNTSFLMQTHIENPIEIDEVNLKIKEASKLQEDSFAWFRALGIISNNLPRGVFVESLKIDKEEERVDFTGVALSRKDLIYFKENLENSDHFSDLDFPRENMLKKEDIFFNVSAEINLKVNE